MSTVGWIIAASVLGPIAVYVLVRFGASAYFRSRADYINRLRLNNKRKVTNGSAEQ